MPPLQKAGTSHQKKQVNRVGVWLFFAACFVLVSLFRVSNESNAYFNAGNMDHINLAHATQDSNKTIFSHQVKADPCEHPSHHEQIGHFRNVALSLHPVSDKIGVISEHRYHNMYGIFLLPYAANKPEMKMLEIGLGCNMNYGPGASVAMWKKLFPAAELWEAEYVKECVEKSKKNGQLDGINILVGDQADKPTLDAWINQSGGKFDIIIDDGGHHNCQIYNSFQKLWPELLPGGFYFIEDLHVGKWSKYIGKECQNILMKDLLHDYMDQLMFATTKQMFKETKYVHKIPEDVQFVHCIAEACVIGKRFGSVNDPSPHN